MKSIPNCIPEIAGNEVQYLTECVDTGWLSPVGPFVDRFEETFAAYHGVEQAVAVSSGTAALHLGLVAVGVRPGDAVICPTLTFIGSVNPVMYCGARPLFLGSEPQTLNMDPEVLADFLENETEKDKNHVIHKETGSKIGALMIVHLYGHPAEMDPIMRLAEAYGLPVVEDCAESLGAKYQNQLVGTFGDVGCFSFNGNKVITSGGGGMLIARDPVVAEKCKHLSTQAKTDSLEFIHDEIGFNYRLSNLCAAVGLAQLERLDEFIEIKRAHTAHYKSLLNDKGKVLVLEHELNRFNTYWMTLARMMSPSSDFIERLRSINNEGVGVRPIWHSVHTLPPFKDNFVYWGDDREDDLYRSVLCLPSSVGLTEEEIHRTAEAVQAGVS